MIVCKFVTRSQSCCRLMLRHRVNLQEHSSCHKDKQKKIAELRRIISTETIWWQNAVWAIIKRPRQVSIYFNCFDHCDAAYSDRRPSIVAPIRLLHKYSNTKLLFVTTNIVLQYYRIFTQVEVTSRWYERRSKISMSSFKFEIC